MWPGNLSPKQSEKEITPLSHHHQRPTTQDPRRVLLKSSTYRHSGALFSHRPLEPELQREKKNLVQRKLDSLFTWRKIVIIWGKWHWQVHVLGHVFWQKAVYSQGIPPHADGHADFCDFQTLSSPSHLSRLTLWRKPQHPNEEEKLQWSNFCFTSLFAFIF